MNLMWTWWYCNRCGCYIRSNAHPWRCVCGSSDVQELWFTDPPPNQGQMFKRGAVDRDLTDPDNAEQAWRREVRELLLLRESLTVTEQDRKILSQRAVPARAHWLPFGAFVHNGHTVGVVGLK